MITITKMNATACHAPWQTETDWYMVGASGDGCDFEVVKGWTAVISFWCRSFINGGTIQDAIDNNWEELHAHLLAFANEDEWTLKDNGEGRNHAFTFDGYCCQGVIYLLTAPPADIAA